MPKKKKSPQPQPSSEYRFVAAELVGNIDRTASEYRYVDAELANNNDGTVSIKLPPNMPADALINLSRSYIPFIPTN